MRGVLSQHLAAWQDSAVRGLAGTDTAKTLCRVLKNEMPGVIRKVVEGQTSLALDAKADREALIRDLIEALC